MGTTWGYDIVLYTCKSTLCGQMPRSPSSSEAEAVSHHRRRITSSEPRHLVERHLPSQLMIGPCWALAGCEKLLSSARIDVHKDEKLSCCCTKPPTSSQTTPSTLFALAACLASFCRFSSAAHYFVTLLPQASPLLRDSAVASPGRPTKIFAWRLFAAFHPPFSPLHRLSTPTHLLHHI